MTDTPPKPIRCFCRRQPLLAVYGVDEKGKPFVHVKVYKSRRIFGEILVTKGDIQLRCRECMRWYKIEIVADQAQLIETPEPETFADDSSGAGMVDSSPV